MKYLAVFLLSVMLVTSCFAGPARPISTYRPDVIHASFFAASRIGGWLINIKQAFGKLPVGMVYRIYLMRIKIRKFPFMTFHSCWVRVDRLMGGMALVSNSCVPPV